MEGRVAAGGAGDMGRIADAFRRQARNIQYADFKTTEDFSIWLAGYREKIRNAFGLNREQDDQVDAEVLRSISGKLHSGTALDTYNRLPAAIKGNYAQLVERLTAEFIDPQEQQRFLEDYSYDKRQKGQSLKDFMQQIIKNQNKYAGMNDEIGVGADRVKNVTKIHDGIRRFKKGIRNRQGKKDKNQIRHLQYNLLKNDDLTWENALEVASRWEAANDFGRGESSSSSSSESDNPHEAVETEKEKEKRKKSKKDKKSDAKTVIINAIEESTVLATLADRVKTNERDIKGVKSEQEKLSANIKSWRDENAATLEEILQTVKGQASQKQQPNTTAAPAAANVAAFEMDPAAQPLGAEGEDTITIPMDQFLKLTARAGEEIKKADIVAAISHQNFY